MTVCWLFLVLLLHSQAFQLIKLKSAVLSGLLLINITPSLGTCESETNSITGSTVQFCRELGLIDGSDRLRSCRANENCFSTSSITAGKSVSPYIYLQPYDDAITILRESLKLEGITILKSKEINDNYYIIGAQKSVPRQPAGSSLFYEFLIKKEPKVIQYRALVDKTVFVYPLQQPVSDFGALQSKLNAVFRRTSFRLQDLSEMYDNINLQ